MKVISAVFILFLALCAYGLRPHGSSSYPSERNYAEQIVVAVNPTSLNVQYYGASFQFLQALKQPLPSDYGKLAELMLTSDTHSSPDLSKDSRVDTLLRWVGSPSISEAVQCVRDLEFNVKQVNDLTQLGILHTIPAATFDRASNWPLDPAKAIRTAKANSLGPECLTMLLQILLYVLNNDSTK